MVISDRTVFSVLHSLHMFQPCGYKVDIAASAKVISLKFSEIPLWHIRFGSRFIEESGGALGSLCFTKIDIPGQRVRGEPLLPSL